MLQIYSWGVNKGAIYWNSVYSLSRLWLRILSYVNLHGSTLWVTA